MTRRLAAILAADIVGYSRLMREDEEGTLAAIKDVRRLDIAPTLAARGGRIVKLMGDGMLVEFSSALEAVRAAMEIQQAIADGPVSGGITYRVGVNLGDVVHEGPVAGNGSHAVALQRADYVFEVDMNEKEAELRMRSSIARCR